MLVREHTAAELKIELSLHHMHHCIRTLGAVTMMHLLSELVLENSAVSELAAWLLTVKISSRI